MLDAITISASGDRSFGGNNNSPVKSYSFNNGSVVVNVTQPGHLLFPGYVARTVEDGNAMVYGEGTGLSQSKYLSLIGDEINSFWESLVNNLICGCKQ